VEPLKQMKRVAVSSGMNLAKAFLYIRESHQQLRRLSLLVIGCYT
jgi:hypothetical protein